MPPRRNARRRRIEEVYGDGNPPPNQLNPEIFEVVQQALNSMMPGLITQVVEVVRQARGTATPNNARGDSKKKSRNSSSGNQSGQTTTRQKYNSVGQRKQASSR
ncbi:hypothetical protein L6452_05989 [Arctium lappa]|uniref:Uncharacterized protein n=1 Tax=Arctium lappa TaxID=4217 RepID=A0ACB9EIL5_ARCLA|nr:hypothetical protein L6452_05989 [Arctium lappa]